MYIVAWSVGTAADLENDSLTDYWSAFDEESVDLAVKRYRELLNDDRVYTVTLAGTIASTDYDGVTEENIEMVAGMVDEI